MLNIGDFARHGQVSVRMLRHYDSIGLLTPAVVLSTGYRNYQVAQLARLNRVVALKDLGFNLEQVGAIIDDQLNPEQLRGMLRLRQAELQTQLAADTTRLANVEARLQLIESEGSMPTEDIQIKSLPAVRVAELVGRAEGFAPEAIGPVIQPLYPQLYNRLSALGITPVGPGIAYYENTDDGGVLVHASAPVSADVVSDGSFTIVELPAVEQAATIVHQGLMDNVMSTIQTMARWIEANGYVSTGLNRELYLDYGCNDQPETWVTELQEPVRKA